MRLLAGHRIIDDHTLIMLSEYKKDKCDRKIFWETDFQIEEFPNLKLHVELVMSAHYKCFHDGKDERNGL